MIFKMPRPHLEPSAPAGYSRHLTGSRVSWPKAAMANRLNPLCSTDHSLSSIRTASFSTSSSGWPLARDIVAAILAGKQPAGLAANKLMIAAPTVRAVDSFASSVKFSRQFT
jgi:hypothetical protein